MFTRPCVCVCVCVCVCARMRACVHASVRAQVFLHEQTCMRFPIYSRPAKSLELREGSPAC